VKIKDHSFLVTGGAGFIGSHLVDMLLEEGASKVWIFDNFMRGGEYNLKEALKDKRVKLFEGKSDLLHQEQLERATQGIDGVFHLASLCLAHCQDDPHLGVEINIMGTQNLLQACVKNHVQRVMFASSSSIYGNAKYSPMDENHPLETRNFYGATKIAGEALCRAFYYKYGLDYLAYRFMNIYGPRQDYLGVYIAIIIIIVDRLLNNRAPTIYGDGSQAFDFVYVEDACRSLILGMDSSKTNEFYNISSGKQISILNLFKVISQIMGKNIPPEFKPSNDNTLVNNRIGSTEKAKKDLGFEAKISLEEGLKQVINWKVNTLINSSKKPA